MRPWHLACALTILAGAGATPVTTQDPAPGPAYWDSVTAAAPAARGWGHGGHLHAGDQAGACHHQGRDPDEAVAVVRDSELR